ncbi:MAG: class I SAM-dependent methyltransferase [Caulobacterales bacterium]|jgi:tRNA (mo5U34)-methyltransferase
MDGSHPGAETAPQIGWFHSLTLPGGETTSGVKSAQVLGVEADVVFKHGVAGKRVLDIGAWDGFFSFEAERRGAAEVLATDHFCWSGDGWGTKAGFDYAHGRLGSRVATRDCDVQQISPQTVGTFDVVLFLGVLYHVKDPMLCLEHAASVAGEVLVVETCTALDVLPWPVMRYYVGGELGGDPTNFWAPNRKCLEGMARDLGFTRIEMTGHPVTRPHWRAPELYWKHNRVFMHAWR